MTPSAPTAAPQAPACGDVSAVAQVIYRHLHTTPSARVPDLRKVTQLGSQAAREAALELCRAGLVTSEWNGMRFRLRETGRQAQ